MPNLFTASVEDKAQADGAQAIESGVADRMREHQLAVVVSATPTSGALEVSVRQPGAPAAAFKKIGEVDLTSTTEADLMPQWRGIVAEWKFTPVGFDADKTYSVYIASAAGA